MVKLNAFVESGDDFIDIKTGASTTIIAFPSTLAIMTKCKMLLSREKALCQQKCVNITSSDLFNLRVISFIGNSTSPMQSYLNLNQTEKKLRV